MPVIKRPPDSPVDRNDDRVPLFDDLRQAVADVSIAIADFACSSMSAMNNTTATHVEEARRQSTTEPHPQVTLATESPRRPDSPPPAQTTAAVPGGLMSVAAAHPYSTAFLIGALLTGSCLAGAAAANAAFARSARRSSSAAAATRAASALVRSPTYDARLERIETLLREAAERPVSPEPAMTERLEHVNAMLATNNNLNRKIQASLDSLKTKQTSELVILRQEMQDQLHQAIKTLRKAIDDERSSHNDSATLLQESLKSLQSLTNTKDNGDSTRVKSGDILDGPTPMDVNAASAAADIAESATKRSLLDSHGKKGLKHTLSTAAVEAAILRLIQHVKTSEPSLGGATGSVVPQLVAVVKAAEPAITARFKAATAEWEMIHAIKASEPYLSQDNLPGAAQPKLLQAVKEAEPFASKRLSAANAVWRLVQIVKASEPRLENRHSVSQAEYDLVRAIKAAEPYLAEDLDMGSAASKLLRKVLENSPHLPPYGSKAAAYQLPEKVKHSEPVLRRPPKMLESSNPASLESPVAGPDVQLGPIRRVKATSYPIAENAPDGYGVPPEPTTSQATETQKERTRAGAAMNSPAKTATLAEAKSFQPVEHLGIDDSGQWRFTVTTAPKAAPVLGEGVQVAPCQIFLSHQFQRSWAGELLSLWQASVRTMTWSVGPFTTALILNPDVDMVLLDNVWWRCSREGDMYTIREMVARNCE